MNNANIISANNANIQVAAFMVTKSNGNINPILLGAKIAMIENLRTRLAKGEIVEFDYVKKGASTNSTKVIRHAIGCLYGAIVAPRISGNGAKNIALLLYAALKEEKKTKGKARLSNMLKSGKELKVYTITQNDLAKFSYEAKRYGVLYCVLKDRKNTDPSAAVAHPPTEFVKWLVGRPLGAASLWYNYVGNITATEQSGGVRCQKTNCAAANS